MAGLPSSSCQTTQDSLRRRSSKLLCLLGSISSLRSMSREERILKCHSLAECGGCWWLRSLAWTKHLLFPELSTVADCTVEAVGCLQYSSHQFLPCPALPCPQRSRRPQVRRESAPWELSAPPTHPTSLLGLREGIAECLLTNLSINVQKSSLLVSFLVKQRQDFKMRLKMASCL